MIFKNIGRVDYMKNLPFDVLSNIVSCTHGDPDYVKKIIVKHWREYIINIEILKQELNENIESLGHTVLQ
jgi:hypothetical protein